MTTFTDTQDWVTSVGTPSATLYNQVPVGVVHIPTAGYNTLIVTIETDGGVSPIVCSYEQFPGVGDNIEAGVLSADATGARATWAIPVIGSDLVLIPPAGADYILTVTGVPAVLARKTMDDGYPYRKFQKTVPSGTASGANVALPGVLNSLDADNPDLSSYNGLVTYSFTMSALGGATSWSLKAGARRPDGSEVIETLLAATVAATVTVNQGHPFGYTKWYVSPNALTTANVIATLLITPSSVL